MITRLMVLALCAMSAFGMAACLAAPEDADIAAPEPTEIPRGPFTEEEVSEIRQAALERINFDRDVEGLPPLEWDEDAAEVGDLFCAVSLRDDTVGHYTLEGLSPLDRWGLYGGGPYVAENACAWAWSGPNVSWTRRGVLHLLDEFQDLMLAERPPNDGHRRTILDPHLTHVGIGLALSGNQLRYVQEYTARYVELDEVPLESTSRERLAYSGRVLDPSRYRLDYILVYHKDPPEPLTVAECAARMSYELPSDHRVLRPVIGEGMYYQSDGGRGEFTYDPDTGDFEATVRWYNGSGWYGILCLLAPTHAGRGQGQFSGTWSLVQVS
jgi:uncharacterized protein YkwD